MCSLQGNSGNGVLILISQQTVCCMLQYCFRS